MPESFGASLRWVPHIGGPHGFLRPGHCRTAIYSILLLSFTNIKGNLPPEDCFLNRHILDFPAADSEAFATEFVERTRRSSFFGNGCTQLLSVRKADPRLSGLLLKVWYITSDHENLLDISEHLPCPKMFMFGAQYRALSYLTRISMAGVELAEIPKNGHFFMYTNPVAMWERMESFHARVSGTYEE